MSSRIEDCRLQRRVWREIRRLDKAHGTRGEGQATQRLVGELRREYSNLNSLFWNLQGVNQEDLRNKCEARIVINHEQTTILQQHLRKWKRRLLAIRREEDAQDMREKCAVAAEARMRASAV